MWVAIYPKDMPDSGIFGTNKEHYNKYYSQAYVKISPDGYPTPTHSVFEAKHWDSFESAQDYFNHFSKYPFSARRIMVEFDSSPFPLTDSAQQARTNGGSEYYESFRITP